MARICLVTREHRPIGGGIGVSVPALAGALATEHEVTLITEDPGDQQLHPPPPGVRRHTVRPAADHEDAGFACSQHAWSAAVLAGVEECYGTGPGPDLLEAPDYCGEAHVVLQAAHTGHDLLASTRILVRLRGSCELSMLANHWWPDDEPTRAIYAMEREALATADRVVYAGGEVADVYARYYGADRVAPARRVRTPLPPLGPFQRRARAADEPLGVLFAGRLERRKGVLELVEAVLRLPDAHLTLTLAGHDTRTGPLGRSIADIVAAMAAGDDRIRIDTTPDRDALVAAMADADVVAIPSRFEWWANVAHEALAVGTPILATPVGGFLEQVVPGETGWLTTSTGTESIAAALAALAHDRAEVDRVRVGGGCQRLSAALTDPDLVLAGYRQLLAEPTRRPRPRRAPATTAITAVIASHDDAELAQRAVASFLAEAGAPGDVVVVDDGSAPSSFAAFDELRHHAQVRVVHQRRGGPSAARNTGLLFADGAFVVVLDADDVLLPGFLDRAITALTTSPELAYAVPWHDLAEDGDGGHGWCPLGAGRDDETWRLNVFGGSCVVLSRPALADSGVVYEPSNFLNSDRELLVALHRKGYRGCVVPVLGVHSPRRADGISRSFFAAHRNTSINEVRARQRMEDLGWMPTS